MTRRYQSLGRLRRGFAALAVVSLATLAGAAGAEEFRRQASPLGNPNYDPPPAKEGYSYPDCYCTDSEGARVEMGQFTCLRLGGRDILARCEMSVNNPTWRHMEGGCPSV